MEIMAERPPRLARAATAPIPGMSLPAPPAEAHVNNRHHTKRRLVIDLQRMQNMLSEFRNRRSGPRATTTTERDKDSSIKSGEGGAPISRDGEEGQGTYEMLNHFCE
jgi:hypothetical protein